MPAAIREVNASSLGGKTSAVLFGKKEGAPQAETLEDSPGARAGEHGSARTGGKARRISL